MSNCTSTRYSNLFITCRKYASKTKLNVHWNIISNTQNPLWGSLKITDWCQTKEIRQINCDPNILLHWQKQRGYISRSKYHACHLLNLSNFINAWFWRLRNFLFLGSCVMYLMCDFGCRGAWLRRVSTFFQRFIEHCSRQNNGECVSADRTKYDLRVRGGNLN